MYKLSLTEQKYIIDAAIDGSRLYRKYLVPYVFLIITDDGKSHEVCFNKIDFSHLLGVRSTIGNVLFFNNSYKGIIERNNLRLYQHYDFHTIKKKIKGIRKIHKIIYTNGNDELVLINYHTKTYDFPVAIANKNEDMIVAFKGFDLHARSLRTYGNINSDIKRNIIGIFAKEKNSKQSYNKMIYIKSYKLLEYKYKNLRININVDILNRMYHEHLRHLTYNDIIDVISRFSYS